MSMSYDDLLRAESEVFSTEWNCIILARDYFEINDSALSVSSYSTVYMNHECGTTKVPLKKEKRGILGAVH